jgi:hypothetical protein
MQPCSSGQTQQIYTLRGDILAHLPGNNLKTRTAQGFMQFTLNQVYLTKVRLGRVSRHPRTVLDGSAGMGIALYS